MNYLVEVMQKRTLPDPLGKAAVHNAADLHIAGIGPIRVGRIYHIEGSISDADIDAIASQLLNDPVTQEYTVRKYGNRSALSGYKRRIEVWYHACVTDSVGETVKIGIADLGIEGITRVSTGTSYNFSVALADDMLARLAQKVLANRLIQTCVLI
jgi:phosphoribosylformylglycinamidine (FGAM) synthase PurS component